MTFDQRCLMQRTNFYLSFLFWGLKIKENNNNNQTYERQKRAFRKKDNSNSMLYASYICACLFPSCQITKKCYCIFIYSFTFQIMYLLKG